MKKFLSYSVILLLFLNLKCEKDPLPEGIETRVYGRVFDFENQLPVTSQVLYIAEYKDKFVVDGGSTDRFVQYVDSTITDNEGNYDMIFKTSGKGNSYKIRAKENISVGNEEYAFMDIEEIEEDNKIDLELLNLFPCELNITLNNITDTPIEIKTDYLYFNAVNSIEVSNGMVQRIIYIDKNHPTELSFRRVKENYGNQYFNLEIPTTNTTELTTYSVTLHNEDF